MIIRHKITHRILFEGSKDDLSRADLSEADLSEADLSRADLSEADLSGADFGDLDIPAIKDIHQVMHQAVISEGCSLNMEQWHQCATTHCIAGWVVHLAGEEGKTLEAEIGTNAAASLIYITSDPSMERMPDYYCSNEEGLEYLKEMAEATQC